MHKSIKKIIVLCLGTKEFNNSLNEIKDFLDFNIVFIDNLSKDLISDKYSSLLIDSDFLSDLTVKYLNAIDNKPKLLISSSKNFTKFKYTENILRPINIYDINKKIIKLDSQKRFIYNSTIKIKDYILDKNEKKLKKNSAFIIITEKEIQLLELLFKKKIRLPKKQIQKEVWQYSTDADTHTVETHIYRLRKKIFDKFKDSNLISNNKDGYTI
jgi:hypothetical protein